MRKLGLNLISIPFWEWPPEEDKRVSYVERRLRESLLPFDPDGDQQG